MEQAKKPAEAGAGRRRKQECHSRLLHKTMSSSFALPYRPATCLEFFARGCGGRLIFWCGRRTVDVTLLPPESIQ